MPNSLFLCSGGQMAETPEAHEAEMQAWGTWLGGLGESVADIGVYNTHPLHEPLKKYSFPNSEQIISVDFEIPKDTP